MIPNITNSGRKVTVLFSMLYSLVALNSWGQQRKSEDNSVLSIQRNKTDNTPVTISFSQPSKWRMDQAQAIFAKYLALEGNNNKMVLKNSTTTKMKVTTDRYTQYYKGVKVEYGAYTLTGKDGLVSFITGNGYNINYN